MLFCIYFSSEKVARTKSATRPMTSEELAEVGVTPSLENIPQGASSQAAENVRESG
jgi:hypothetical protein